MKIEVLNLRKANDKLGVQVKYMENNLKPVQQTMISERSSDEDDDEGLVTTEALQDHIANTFELFKDDVQSRLIYTWCIQDWYQVRNTKNEMVKLDPTYFEDLKLNLNSDEVIHHLPQIFNPVIKAEVLPGEDALVALKLKE